MSVKGVRKGPTLGSIADRALACLREHGPMSCAQIADEIDERTAAVNWGLWQHRGALCHISAWERDDGMQCRAHAIYKAGPGRDKRKNIAPLSGTEVARRYRGRLKTCVNSVFALGTRVDTRRIGAYV
jgi:hypothetical protein